MTNSSLLLALERARDVLARLELQAAAYPATEIPVHLQIEIEEQRKKVADLEAAVQSQKSPDVSRQSAEPSVSPATDAGAAIRKLPRWLWLAGGSVVIITLAIVIAQSWGWFDGEKTAATQTTAALAVTPIPTATPTIPPPSRTSTVTPTRPPSLTPTRTLTPTATPYPAQITDVKGVQMALIPAGTFQMGSESYEYSAHMVNLTISFYMDIYEVTNASYATCVVAGKCSLPASYQSYTRSSYYDNTGYANYPVINVNRTQASTYCAWRDARLPTEAEWEYAARGGLESKAYPWGDESPICTAEAGNGAKFDDSAGCHDTDTESVGSYAPNGYRLYDMAGNVWEWVNDWYGAYSSAQATDPTGPTSGENGVLRGGSWGNPSSLLHVAFRLSESPIFQSDYLGFRCVVSTGNEQVAATPAPTAIPVSMEGELLVVRYQGLLADKTVEVTQTVWADTLVLSELLANRWIDDEVVPLNQVPLRLASGVVLLIPWRSIESITQTDEGQVVKLTDGSTLPPGKLEGDLISTNGTRYALADAVELQPINVPAQEYEYQFSQTGSASSWLLQIPGVENVDYEGFNPRFAVRYCFGTPTGCYLDNSYTQTQASEFYLQTADTTEILVRMDELTSLAQTDAEDPNYPLELTGETGVTLTGIPIKINALSWAWPESKIKATPGKFWTLILDYSLNGEILMVVEQGIPFRLTRQ
jgi:formylglycine-generating enzyme